MCNTRKLIIRTITCHDVYNYGASLQSFALQSYINNLGYDVKIIDYKPSYQDAYVFTTNVSEDSPYYKLCKKYPFLLWIRAVKNYISSRKTIGRKKAFNNFTKHYLKLTLQYKSYKQLVAFPPIADIYIAGSDQIWNTRLPNGSDPAFYMQFGDLNVKRISYASSFATSTIQGGYDCLVSAFLSKLNAISVRESSGLSILNKMGFDGIRVLDPVFLLSKEEWIERLNIDDLLPLVNGRYVLCYDLRNTIGIKERVISLSKEFKIPIVSINDKFSKSYADININNAGPREFLKLILNAEFVITDSFHATAFSVLFKKQFWSYFRFGNNMRIKDFLEMIHLSERLNRQDNYCSIDWNITSTYLDSELEVSKNYLKIELFK